ncbi:hypothetical protein IEQ34_005704 [Dendrobium chrysotoxum]|uniref:Integrator complex subunit 4/Protein SIEL C-terminal Ig-like domain-containing protein n=1 Tax=Dendrobium chrysotoxum TaxID=161865 RepID=A0AAV7H8V4_DENCH|nr:hypothetical protein IEQ34_005704 [Dendrobium chrysotoxum]
MKLFKWTPHFDINVESPIVPIWVSFPSLHPHLFCPRILHGYGSLFGRPLRTDNATTNGSRLSKWKIFSRLGHSKDGCSILFPNLGVAPPVKEGTVAYVASSHDLDGLNITPAIGSVGVVQGDLVKNQDFIYAYENDGVVSPLLNDAAVGVQLIGSDDVGVCAMTLSHVEVQEEGNAERVSFSPILVRTGGGVPSDSPVTAGSLGTESLVEVPIVVMSSNCLNAQFVSNLGVTCLGQSGWNDGSPSSPGEFLGLLNDVNAIIRFASRKLLLLVELPKLEIFKAAINSILTNLERHPEEEEDVFFILFCIGISNAKLALKLAKEFASVVQPFSVGELILDSPWAAGHLVLIVSSTFSSKQKISDIPTVLFSYAVPLVGRISRSLGGFVSQYFLSNYLCHLSGVHSSFGIPMSEETKLTATKLEETLANSLKCRDKLCNSLLLLHDENLKSKCKEGKFDSCQVSASSELFLQRGVIDDRLMQSVKFILGKVQETWHLIHSHCGLVALRNLRACKEELDFINLDINGSGADFVAFGLEYVQVIMLFAEIWQQIYAKNFRVTAMVALDILIEKLDVSLRRLKYCFLGLSIEEECHLLELILVSHVLRLHKFQICSRDILMKMDSTISCLQILCKEGSNISAFIKEVKMYSTEEGTNECSREFPVDNLLQLFYLRLIPFCGKFRQIKADLTAIGYSSENPLHYVSGLPVGITFEIFLYNTSQMERVWLKLAVDGSFQYIFLDLCKFRGCHELRKGTLTIPYYAAPRAASFVLKACICIEFPVGDFLHLKRKVGGPKHDSIRISQEVDIYFVGIGSC